MHSVTDQAVIAVTGIWKRFGEKDVVQDVSFTVGPGEVVGVVGPNGAGKTTSIRIALGIISPDRGQVTILGKPIAPESQNRLGYLPEERGLYRGRKVRDVLTYLGALKGLTKPDARRRAQQVIDRLGMGAHAEAKISDLSHGMAQLIQFSATILHEPQLVVLDEPFNALDPVNLRLMKAIILEMRQKGTAVILSTHQMNQVEELCDRVVMIDQGRVVLQGSLAEIRRSYVSDALSVVCDPIAGSIDGVTDLRRQGRAQTMRLQPGTTPEHVLRQLLDQGCAIERFELAAPSLEEIFVMVVKSNRG